MSLIKRGLNKYRSDGFISFSKSTGAFVRKSIRRTLVDPVKVQLWKSGLIGIDQLYKSSYYKSMARRGAQADARRLSELIIEIYDPDRVVDLGCGVGRFIKPLYEQGVEVYGVDGAEKAIKNAIVPENSIAVHDLTEPYRPKESADVVLCIEVLEHLPEESASTAVKSISAVAPIAIVTTARPGQGGKHHINEQPLSYWIEKFSEAGMIYDEDASSYFLTNVDAEELRWLNENIAVFRSKFKADEGDTSM